MAALDPAHNPHHSIRRVPREARQVVYLSVLLWLIGMPGVLALCLHAQPQLIGSTLSPQLLAGMLAAQLALLLAAACFVGTWVAPRLGIPVPLWSAWQDRGQGRWLHVLHLLWLPALGGGVLGAAWMVTLSQMTPGIYIPGNPLQAWPLWAKCLVALPLELLVHWGLMASLLFGMWRVVQPRGGVPHMGVVAMSLLLSGLALGGIMVFASQVILGTMTLSMLGLVMLEYTLWGMIAGYIFWRHGLEAALLAHMLALAFSHGLA